jgi:hypothetical protein
MEKRGTDTDSRKMRMKKDNRKVTEERKGG